MQGRAAAAAGGRAATGQMYPAVHVGRAGDAMQGDGQGFEGIPAILRGHIHFHFIEHAVRSFAAEDALIAVVVSLLGDVGADGIGGVESSVSDPLRATSCFEIA